MPSSPSLANICLSGQETTTCTTTPGGGEQKAGDDLGDEGVDDTGDLENATGVDGEEDVEGADM